MKNLKIKTILITSFGAIILLTLALGAFASLRANLIGRYYREFIDEHFYVVAGSQTAIDHDAIISYGIEAVYLIIAISLMLIAVAIVMAVCIIRNITHSINELKKSSQLVAQGNLSVDMRTNSRSELGELSNSIADMVDVFKSIVDELDKMEREFNIQGDFEYRLETGKYKNDYKAMIEGIHRVTDGLINDITSTLTVATQIGDGNFNVEILDMPGKKMIVPQTLRAVVTNLKNVDAEVSAMIEAAAVKGNLDFAIDTNKYKGNWGEMVNGLNRIAKAVDAPLKVIDIAMHEMKDGNFDLSLINSKISAAGLDPNTENYSGVFKDILSTLGASFSETASYINEIEETLAKVAQGDLRNNIKRHYVGSFYAIKRSVNIINDTLYKTMSEISTATDQVLAGANQISTNAANLASGAQEQSSSVQELNASIEMISQQTSRNADNATTANVLSNKSTENAGEGANAMKQMVEAMEQIKESSNNISHIVKTVQDIAFQTNLLALNASVEAARAGEHGKGFAVVADEVRTLAGRSQVAAAETTALITDSIKRVESGAVIAETTTESLNAIVESASEVLEAISSISAASKEQAEALAQISGGIAQISQVTQANSAVSEETAAASEELNAQAETLRQLVGYFKL